MASYQKYCSGPAVKDRLVEVYIVEVGTTRYIEDLATCLTLQQHIEVETLPLEAEVKTKGPVGHTLTNHSTVVIVDYAVAVQILEANITRSCLRLQQSSVGVPGRHVLRSSDW